MFVLRKFAMAACVSLVAVALGALCGGYGADVRAAMPGGPGRGTAGGNAPHSLSPYFTPAKPGDKAPDADGFLQRWLLLEPINEPFRGNTGFTSSFVEGGIKAAHFPDQYVKVPHDGDTATVDGNALTWHALDSTMFNVKLFRFADGLGKSTYGVMFWAITVVDSPREMQNVRLAVGSNSASMWWVNGKEAAGLFGDRRMVQDDVVSKRLTLQKGPNVIHGAVINGPGMSDFCARFIDENGDPVKDLTINLQSQ